MKMRDKIKQVGTSAGLMGAVFAWLLVAGCEPAPVNAPEQGDMREGMPLTVGFAQVGAESAWRTAETQSIKDEAEQREVNLRFVDAQGKQENQIKAVRSFIEEGVHAIILAPVVETGWGPVLKEAQEAEIPVVLVDRGVEEAEELYATLIASDFILEGNMAATWLVEKTGGSAKIVELQGTTGSAPANDRKKGFGQGIAGQPGMTIIDSQSGDFRRANGKQVMEAFLKKHGKTITAVYAHNDDMALGAIQAIEESGMKPGEDVVVVGIDGVKDAFSAIVAGKMNCTVECNPLLGPLAFDAVLKAVSGQPLEKRIVVQDRLFDTSNAAAEIDNRQY